jgi:eukaryotic-like serine/threonine-protein kinase
MQKKVLSVLLLVFILTSMSALAGNLKKIGKFPVIKHKESLANLREVTETFTFDWSFSTEGKILSSPLMLDNFIYVGSDDGNFYALNAKEGKEIWRFNTGNAIRCTAIAHGQLVIFQSGNRLIALDRQSGKLKWQFYPEGLKGKTTLQNADSWDYHHSSPVLHNKVVYYGNDYGSIYGINLKDGKKIMEYTSSNKSAIRATPAIDDNILFFGDFEGYLYAYNLKKKKLEWSLKTYDKKDYPGFGAIISKIKVEGDNLFFGARNYHFQVLNKKTGALVWKYTNPSGGWISGTPVVKDGKVYVGGSDTHSLHVFEEATGKELQVIPFKNGGAMFSEPVLFDNYVMVQTGDAYNSENGKGFIYILNRTDGTMVREYEIGGNVFTTSVYNNKSIYISSFDKKVYAIKLKEL